jgi:hypothetical protein
MRLAFIRGRLLFEDRRNAGMLMHAVPAQHSHLCSYRLRNVRAGYVLYRALVNEIERMEKNSTLKNARFSSKDCQSLHI